LGFRSAINLSTYLKTLCTGWKSSLTEDDLDSPELVAKLWRVINLGVLPNRVAVGTDLQNEGEGKSGNKPL